MVSRSSVAIGFAILLTALALACIIVWGIETSRIVTAQNPSSSGASPSTAPSPPAPPVEPIPSAIMCSLTKDWMSLPLNVSCPAPNLTWCREWRDRSSPACVFESCSALFYFGNIFSIGIYPTGAVVNGTVSTLELAVQNSSNNLLYAGSIRNLVIDNEPDSVGPIVPAPTGLNQTTSFNFSSDAQDFQVNARAFAQEAAALRWSALSFENLVTPALSSMVYYYRYNSYPSTSGCGDTEFNDIPWLFETGRPTSLDSVLQYVDFLFQVYIGLNTGNGTASVDQLCASFSPPALFCNLFKNNAYYTPQSLWNTTVTPNPYVDAHAIARVITAEFEACQGTSCFKAVPYEP